MKPELVGVRELKARLSAYLRAVAGGQTILVGDRSKRPIAQLAPLRRSKEATYLEQLDRDGLVRRGRGRLGQKTPAKKRTKRSVAAMVSEDRR